MTKVQQYESLRGLNVNAIHPALVFQDVAKHRNMSSVVFEGRFKYQKVIELFNNWELQSTEISFDATSKLEAPECLLFKLSKNSVTYIAVVICRSRDDFNEDDEEDDDETVFSSIDTSLIDNSTEDLLSVIGVTIYHDCTINKIEDNEILKYFRDSLPNIQIEVNTTACINILASNNSTFYAKTFYLDQSKVNYKHMDEHYGDGFKEFHDKLLSRIKNESKGLVLFHGEPGTGKTQYIRALLTILTSVNKSVLYIPPSFAAELTNPAIIDFISSWVTGEAKDCILLIEDAEPVLENRNSNDGRSTGISNLLNITDGILNDMLGIMVIATFNTHIGKIDSALLRPQRLIARKEFHLLTFEQSEKLSKALGIKNPLSEDQYPTSIANFYNYKNESNILTHGVDESKPKIGFHR